jgi:hypothetical protein
LKLCPFGNHKSTTCRAKNKQSSTVKFTVNSPLYVFQETPERKSLLESEILVLPSRRPIRLFIQFP